MVSVTGPATLYERFMAELRLKDALRAERNEILALLRQFQVKKAA